MPSEMRMNWTGGTGGDGVSVMHFENIGGAGEASTAVVIMRTFFTAVATLIPDEIQFLPDPEVRVLDDVTGALVATYSVTPGAVIVGGSSGVYNAAAGARLDWETGVIEGGRRLRGRTFLVPLGSTAYQAGGGLAGAARTQIETAGTTYISQMQAAGRAARVWSRKNGVARGIVSCNAPLQGAILRSRRD